MKKWLKRGLLTLVIAPIAIIVVIVSLYIIFPILNDIKANRLATDWAENIALPDNTEIVEVISGSGNTGGTGNHTEIWAGILIKSNLSSDEVNAFFGSDVFVVDKSNTRTFIMSLMNKKFSYLDISTDYDDLYIIEIIDEAVSSEFDLRGH